MTLRPIKPFVTATVLPPRTPRPAHPTARLLRRRQCWTRGGGTFYKRFGCACVCEQAYSSCSCWRSPPLFGRLQRVLNPEARHLAEHAETSNTMNKIKQRAHAVFVVQRSECTYQRSEKLHEFLVYMFDSSRLGDGRRRGQTNNRTLNTCRMAA